ncbi:MULTISPECIES: hypothetical protein [Maricaulis]|uniref:hypothetical protein n=1 Tax=Maricaulis TaxID=74317 RepID=UPI00032094AC|nr:MULTISPECIES: hypothetical protein [Maricaulis]MAC89736.1 hypothetical protein [Maricaulis sp.]
MKQGEALRALYAKIETQEVACAFWCAVLEMPRIPDIAIEAETHGYMSSLRIKRGGDWCFSLAPAREWLLFYVRRPELKRSKLDYARVKSVLSQSEERGDGEITARVSSEHEILKICDLIRDTI